MIQRIQSIYLIAAIILILACFFIPSWSGVVHDDVLNKDTPLVIRAGQPLEGLGWVSLSTGILGILACAYAIFQFNNRLFQVKIVYGCLAIGVIFMLSLYGHCSSLTGESGRYGQGIILSSLVPVLSFLAARAILGDEKLVRSADRLR